MSRDSQTAVEHPNQGPAVMGPTHEGWRTVPYGMSSYLGPQRLRRAAGAVTRDAGERGETGERGERGEKGADGGTAQRCVCDGLKSDRRCLDFCHSSVPERTKGLRGPGPG
ncbi:unnamed protein product [Arctogadus glacialis]